ncbi:P-loop containing nucleoside triphosphate hydrolase protein, partial [Panaeolus papilionaceus]
FRILGPTGTGKSTFIEALASNASLGISSNRLEGFTQSISAYQLINVQKNSGRPIYLVDVPGFSDTKISEMKILSMLKDWRAKSGDHVCRLHYFCRILYFMPINSPRLSGSQREVLRIFQALTGIKAARGITVVTTMWDCLGSETAKQRANSNFDQLQKDVWK